MKRVTDRDIPKLDHYSGSWFIIRTKSNEVITEIMKADKAMLKSFNADNITILTAFEHLSSIGAINQ